MQGDFFGANQRLSVKVLKSLDIEALGADGFDSLYARFCSCNGGHDRNPILERGGANLNFFMTSDSTCWSVHDKCDLFIFDEIDNVRATFGKFK